MSIGKITNSLAAATVENSLSLFQFNFDFTFKKTAPPVEFYPVGRALSAHRRQSAENGAAHRTARKLGWLFEQLVPDTPRLLKAYGLRVSEILQQPGINPTGSAADGPFRDFVGADCTSLWAAATSGISALGVHLLACMLARAWDAQTATAIWVELIKSRQVEILGKLGQSHVVSETSVTAARQDFLRSELAEWDASARSWLTQADKAFAVKRDQFLLIVKNISLSTGQTPDPYTNVIATWVLAMSTIERHLGGMSQEVSDGATLFAVSAWHLYPDIAHYGSGAAKHIRFSDPLFEEQATMTLGLTEFATTKDTRGTHWSLCLSHLRFYGVPVRVESVEDRTRVTASQFLMIVLGTVLESWHILPQDRQEAIKWISDLWAYLKRTTPFDSKEMHMSKQMRWLAVLGRTAESFANATDIVREQYEDYLDHGEQWGRHFLLDEKSLNHSARSMRPFFGLCNPMTMQALQEPLDIDAGVVYLRLLATRIGLSEDEGIICYTEIRGSKGYYEYCTAAPHLDSSMQSRHARWIKKAQIPGKPREGDLDSHPVSYEGSNHVTNTDEVDLDARYAMVVARGEQCFRLGEGSLHERNITHSPSSSTNPSLILLWENAPSLYTAKAAGINCAQVNSNDTTSCSCLSPSVSPQAPDQGENYQRHMDVKFSRIAGTIVETGRKRDCSLELFVRTTGGRQARSLQYEINEATTENEKPSIGSQWLNGNLPHSTRLWEYIERCGNLHDEPRVEIAESTMMITGLDWGRSHGRAANLISNHIMSPLSSHWIRSLELVREIYDLYEHLPGATISLKVLEYPISHACWGKRLYNSNGNNSTGSTREIAHSLSREEMFSCIAMMQTGSSDIEPEDLAEVMAISADNSIFVAGVLLSDPHMIDDTRSIRHIVGNVGFPGLNLMISPAGTLAIRPPKNEIRSRSRAKYDYNRTDKFGGTSLHLSFTGQRLPLVSTNVNDIDQGIFHLQTVVSLWDAGKHVADLNILDVYRKKLSRVPMLCSCAVPLLKMEGLGMTCLDSWDDIIFPQRRQAIMRSKGNWSARLAAAAIFIQQGKEHAVAFLPQGTVCWKCVALSFRGPDDAINWPDILID